MRKNGNALLVAAIITIVIFALVSACGCFAIMGTYMIDCDLSVAGETFIKEMRSNSFVFILILSLCQVCLLFVKKQWLRNIGIAMSVIAFLSTVVYAPLCNISKEILGGIISYHCEITWLGYIAIVLSALSVFFQIFTLKKQG